MPRYRVEGAMRATGKNRVDFFDADSPEHAEAMAAENGLLAQSTTEADTPDQPVGTPSPDRANQPSHLQPLGPGAHLPVVIVAVACNVIGSLACMGSVIVGLVAISKLNQASQDSDVYSSSVLSRSVASAHAEAQAQAQLGSALETLIFGVLLLALGSGLDMLRQHVIRMSALNR